MADRENGNSVRHVCTDPACSRVSPPGRSHTLRLALILAFPTIGLEQLLHTDRPALAALPLYQTLHWLSDSLLALPMAAIAVWGGERLAARLGLGTFTFADVVGRACVVAVLFALVLAPGAVLHDVADRLTHVHASAATHAHGRLPPRSRGPATLARFVGHALSDGFVGQTVGLPLMVLALMWGRRTPRSRRGGEPKSQEA